MADSNNKENVFSADDPLDINELASLNDDISVEFIEQLQSQVAQNASEFTGKPVNDSELFEEIEATEEKPKAKFDDSIDDNFIKKYKAKLNKQKALDEQKKVEEEKTQEQKNTNTITEPEIKNTAIEKEEIQIDSPPKQEPAIIVQDTVNDIENLTSGNIIERPAVQEQIDYNESLDFLDDNVKYSKYVIYIDPENTDFIESLTVKERKNLINRILREQDDIAITKRRLSIIQTIIKHSIIAVITISIAIPVVYWTVNASLEASINNYRRSQAIFKTLYRDKGKIKTSTQY